MTNNISVRQIFALAFVLAYALVAVAAFYLPPVLWALLLIVPLHLVYLQNIWQRQHTVLRNFPILGYMRYFLESIRPEIRQYFFESDLDGKPFSRRQRSIVYQRAKNVRQTVPFGMQQDSRQTGYEWVAHAMFPAQVKENDLRVWIGSSRCQQPYYCSIYNIAAMSYGALSKTAIEALNGGARLGGFAHNTGEGGVSPYHLTEGGDLIWQMGTGYFGCRDAYGEFSPMLFQQQATHPNIKMIEIKLSQGAKPGLGGILPAAKNTPEIAAIRRVLPYTTVVSPAGHAAFQDQVSMLRFLEELRTLAGGKPIGIKVCIGDRQEFEKLCQEMQRLQLYPDFITIDGAEGGTGAAPLEFADSVGMPLYDALPFVHRKLRQYKLRREVKILAAGKIITGLDIIKAIALGADACYSARGMMFALGCLQALQCDSGRCPVGIATQEPSLFKGLDVQDKKVRVANFHRNTILATIELMEACGFATLADIKPDKIFRRMDQDKTRSFRDIYFTSPGTEKNNAPSYKLNLN
ncbi:FMN-binding glutamate synthase family protein [Adhaeribacter aerolatus]|uniref:FMN-binding glutamate synthase family protein n=1 Tax=Adhaeribacter aerolatus TaxID=670289 RepID=A0A512AYL7_9BACT|nr:FMN-binding glutamate synthase family protein [Adhaeribacter aerolatus]GEO04799.1 FMN-binding glutamate synthase family protein [Adhaeribacter aerolatus]